MSPTDGQQPLACFILLEGGFGNSMDVGLVRHRRFPHPLLAARYRMSVPEGSGGIGKSGSKDGHGQVIELDAIRVKGRHKLVLSRGDTCSPTAPLVRMQVENGGRRASLMKGIGGTGT